MADGAVIMEDAGGVKNKSGLRFKGPVFVHAQDDKGAPIAMDELKDPDAAKRKHSVDLKEVSALSVMVGGTTVTSTSVTKVIISVTETDANNVSRDIQLVVRDGGIVAVFVTSSEDLKGNPATYKTKDNAVITRVQSDDLDITTDVTQPISVKVSFN